MLSSHSLLYTLRLSCLPHNSTRTITLIQLHPMVNSPVFILFDLSAAFDLVNDSSSSKHFLSLATRALCWLSFYLTHCSFSDFAGSSSSLDLFILKLPQNLVFQPPFLSTLIILVISFSSMLLNSINKLVTPEFISAAHISPLISRHIHSTTHLMSPLGYLIGFQTTYPKLNLLSVPKNCSSHSHPHLRNGNFILPVPHVKMVILTLFSYSTSDLLASCC